MKSEHYNILEEKNIIDDHLLDIIGNEFKFDHEKGIAEWLKNSVDAYIRNSVSDNEQHIILRFTDSVNNEAIVECVDFNGMSDSDINKALKRWGDPEAAKRGLNKKTYGGHGNGGKFYMRQMFSRSCFITYKDGFLNIFGFSENKKYGFASGYKNEKIDYRAALKIANLSEDSIPKFFLEKIKNNTTGFTVVRGEGPVNMKNKIKVIKICDKLKKHPQSMRIMDRINLSVIHNNEVLYSKLCPDSIKPLVGFEAPLVIEMPEKISYNIDGEDKTIILSNEKFAKGRLILKTSEIALTNSSRFSDLNRIDVIGELGVVASYYLREFGLYFPQTDFIYGECECPILEDIDNDCVMNDRTKLADNDITRCLLQWIHSQVKVLCEQISKAEEKERQDIKQKISSNFNNYLNQWKNRFMTKILSDVLVGDNNSGTGMSIDVTHNKHESKDGEKNKNNNLNESGGGDKKSKAPQFPRVLLSGYDDDPLNPGGKLFLQPTQGLVYQRGQDVNEGIYWINTTSPLAVVILDRYDANSSRWREYLFHRYIDIFVKEALMQLEKKEPDRFNATTIDGEILGKVVSRIHEAAAKDLSDFLFNEHYVVKE